jgi:hypothetical protein
MSLTYFVRCMIRLTAFYMSLLFFHSTGQHVRVVKKPITKGVSGTTLRTLTKQKLGNILYIYCTYVTKQIPWPVLIIKLYIYCSLLFIGVPNDLIYYTSYYFISCWCSTTLDIVLYLIYIYIYALLCSMALCIYY